MKGHKGKSKKASYFAGVESWKTKRHQKDDFYRKQVEEKELDDLPGKIIDVNKQIEEVFESWEELKAEEEQACLNYMYSPNKASKPYLEIP